MASFDVAYKKTGGFEGGWNHVTGDRGGETYCGIARKYHPKWEGWAIVDAHKPLKHGAIIKDDALEKMVKTFYKKEFWDKVWGGSIHFQYTANELYDMAVNSGVPTAIKLAQRQYKLPETGVMTESLIKKINNL